MPEPFSPHPDSQGLLERRQADSVGDRVERRLKVRLRGSSPRCSASSASPATAGSRSWS